MKTNDLGNITNIMNAVKRMYTPAADYEYTIEANYNDPDQMELIAESCDTIAKVTFSSCQRGLYTRWHEEARRDGKVESAYVEGYADINQIAKVIRALRRARRRKPSTSTTIATDRRPIYVDRADVMVYCGGDGSSFPSHEQAVLALDSVFGE